MAEEAKKEVVVLREIEDADLIAQIPSDARVETFITDRPNTRKFKLVALVPKTDEEAQERYSCSMDELVRKGIVQLMYGLKASAIKAELESGANEASILVNLQAMADEKTAESTRKPGALREVKQKASRLDSIEAKAKKAGFDTVEAYIEALTKKAKK